MGLWPWHVACSVNFKLGKPEVSEKVSLNSDTDDIQNNADVLLKYLLCLQMGFQKLILGKYGI